MCIISNERHSNDTGQRQICESMGKVSATMFQHHHQWTSIRCKNQAHSYGGPGLMLPDLDLAPQTCRHFYFLSQVVRLLSLLYQLLPSINSFCPTFLVLATCLQKCTLSAVHRETKLNFFSPNPKSSFFWHYYSCFSKIDENKSWSTCSPMALAALNEHFINSLKFDDAIW
jgi:hypothetical protein